MASNEILWFHFNDSAPSLRSVAERVFNALGVSVWEERQSVNRPNTQYFAGYAENAAIEVIDRDEEQGEHEYRYELVIGPPRAQQPAAGRILDSVAEVAGVLMQNRFLVFQPSDDWTRPDWDGSGIKYPG